MKKRIAILICVVIVLFSVGIGAVFMSKTAERLDIGIGFSKSNDVVNIEIGDKEFSFTKNYIISREDWSGGRTDATLVMAFLPNFDGLTDLNWDALSLPGRSDIVRIVIEEHNTKGSITGSQSMSRMAVFERITDVNMDFNFQGSDFDPYMYGLFKVKTHTSSDTKDLFVSGNSDGFYWTICAQEWRFKFPSCSAYSEISEKVYVYYTMSRSQLQRWKEIDAGVKKFINDHVVR